MQLSKLACCITFFFGVAACSSTTEVVTADPTPAADGPTDEEDAGEPATDAPATTLEKPGSVCTSTRKCDASGVCLMLPGATAGVCAKTCTRKSECGADDDHSCESVGSGAQACITTCVFSGRCPSGLKCSSVGTCDPDCNVNPGSCGSQLVCRPDGSCGKPPPPACTPQPSSGLAGTKTAGSLTSTEKKTFCDWQACQMGGYGNKATCDGGISTNPPSDQSACLTKFPSSTCAAKVSEMEACVKVQTQQRCSAVVLTAPECASLRACN